MYIHTYIYQGKRSNAKGIPRAHRLLAVLLQPSNAAEATYVEAFFGGIDAELPGEEQDIQPQPDDELYKWKKKEAKEATATPRKKKSVRQRAGSMYT